MARKEIYGAIMSHPHNENYKELYNKMEDVESAKKAADLANQAASSANTAANHATQATNDAIEATNNANTATSNAEAKIVDVEDRFTRLTTEQQQASEVIDARKGKPSLRAKIDEIDSNIDGILNEKYSEPLTNHSSVFSVGTGKDKNGNNVDVSNNVVQGQVSVTIGGVTETDEEGNTKSTVGAMRLKSVGKNLVNKNDIMLGLEYNGTQVFPIQITSYDFSGNVLTYTASNNFRGIGFRVRVEPNKPYYARCDTDDIASLRNTMAFYDKNWNFVSLVNRTGTNTLVGTSPPNSFYATVVFTRSVTGTFSLRNIQIECGNTATPYEPYTESNAYVVAKDSEGKIAELRSLPNGTKDEVRFSEGKVIIKTRERIIQENDVFNMIATYDDVDYATIQKPVDAIFYNKAVSSIAGTADLKGYSEFEREFGSSDTIGKFSLLGQINRLWVGFPKGTTLEQAKQQLIGTPLTYQLATPVEIPIEIEGDLMSYPKGTIYIDPYIANMYSYNNGIVLDYPVTQIDKLMGFVDGVWQELDNTYNLSPDGKTLTIADIDNNDKIKVYAPIRPEESTVPETTHVVPLNTAAQIHDVVVKSSQNTVKLSQHDSMLLGLALSYIDLDVRIKALEV